MKEKRFTFSFLIIAFLGIFLMSINKEQPNIINYSKVVTDLSLEDALLQLGDKKSNHFISKLDSDSVKIGYDLITTGLTEASSNRRLSKFFVCTDCHNLVPESADFSDESPEAKIEFGRKNNLNYLPASTFYGMYNKTNWYNGDYVKKYGKLVLPTRDSLANAIQLCAVQCSQGRPMDDWEIRSVLHYFKSISIQLKDLTFSSEELDLLTKYVLKKNSAGIKLLKSKYNSINEATFGKLEMPVIDNYSGNLENGEYIYKNGCLHCHGLGKNITNFEFDNSEFTLSFFDSQASKKNHFTVHQIVRKGTYAMTGKKMYMPQYPLEKLSEKQLIDLMTYISKNNK